MLTATFVLVGLVVLFAVAFDYTNGFHDCANAVATVVSTGVLPLRTAVIMAGILNAAGAFVSTRVAETIANGLLEPGAATEVIVLAAVIGAIAWNIVTWWFGIPSSSSHALIGGLVGAACVGAGPAVVMWHALWYKVAVPIVASPLVGFIFGLISMGIIFAVARHMQPPAVAKLFRPLQVVSAAVMAFAHGSNDAQKSMGIITMALVSGHMLSTPAVPEWVITACAAAMGVGTMVGGVRIIRTMGEKIIHLEPINGFAAEGSAAAVIFGTAAMGVPVSTTHVIAGSIFGVGVAKSLHGHAEAPHEVARMVTATLSRPPSSAVQRRIIEQALARQAKIEKARETQKMDVFEPLEESDAGLHVNWDVARQMVIAWVLTLPAAGLVGALSYFVLRAFLNG